MQQVDGCELCPKIQHAAAGSEAAGRRRKGRQRLDYGWLKAVTVFCARPQAAQQRAAAEEAEVAGATWTPEISALARDLRRADGRQAWQRLAQASTARSQARP